jgi:phosphoserine / homoserine phosphotransferase
MPWIYCLDLEGVLVPEIWIGVSKKFRMPSLKLTTREIPDYDKLMKYRIGILKKEGIRLRDIQNVIATLRPLPGAKVFLDRLRKKGQVIILSDTFYEFAGPLMAQLGFPTLFCNQLHTGKSGFISGYTLRQKDGKKKAVKALHKIGFQVAAAGDSYNDLTMLRTADRGVLFNPPESIRKDCKDLPAVFHYKALLEKLVS